MQQSTIFCEAALNWSDVIEMKQGYHLTEAEIGQGGQFGVYAFQKPVAPADSKFFLYRLTITGEKIVGNYGSFIEAKQAALDDLRDTLKNKFN